MRRYHPDLEHAARYIPCIDDADLRGARERFVAYTSLAGLFTLPAYRMRVDIVDKELPVPGGSNVVVRLYQPKAPLHSDASVCVLHGGGFLVGDHTSEDMRCLEIASLVGVRVVAVSYRLAPENPFPAAFCDCCEVLRWLFSPAAAVVPERTAILGVSAGGTLAAAVSLAARDGVLPQCGRLVLLYPALDDRLESESMRSATDTPGWNKHLAKVMWESYLRGNSDRRYAVPARIREVSGLPPTYVLTAEHDPLRDEALNFVARLAAAGVSVTHRHVPGGFHGFDALRAPAISQRVRGEVIEFLHGLLDEREGKTSGCGH